MSLEELILAKLKTLEWTELTPLVGRPNHPWEGDILVRRADVEKIIKGG